MTTDDIRNKKHFNAGKIRPIKKDKNLTGQIFGFLEVIEMVRHPDTNRTGWFAAVKCLACNDCPYKIITAYNLIRGDAKSCGCRRHILPEGNVSKLFTGIDEMSGANWYYIKRGAAKRNLEFSITMEYAYSLFLKQNKLCALTDLPIQFGELKTASLDRIDNILGYIEGNVWWVHKNLNRMKHTSNIKEFIEMCQAVADYNKGQI